MKFLIVFFVVSFLTVVNGLTCLTNVLSTNMTCENGVQFCLEVDCMIHGSPFKFQGCNGQISFNVDGEKPLKNCTEVGTKTFTSSGITGQYDCCNAYLCNNKQLDPNA